VAAFRKRKVPFVSDPKMLYQNKEIDASISADGKPSYYTISVSTPPPPPPSLSKYDYHTHIYIVED
jgi:hypothetical protein